MCGVLVYNIIFIARSSNPLLQKSTQSLRQKFSVGVSSVRVVGIAVQCSAVFHVDYSIYLFICLTSGSS